MKYACQILHMTFFFDLVNLIDANSFSEGNQRVLTVSGDVDPIPVAKGAAAPLVADLIQISM